MILSSCLSCVLLGQPGLHATRLQPRRARSRAVRVGPEVDLGHRVVEHELPHGAGDLHLPIEHDVGAIDDIERLLHVVVADQHADAAVAQAGDDGLDVVHGDRVDARERLVEHHELRLGHQRPGDLEAPPLAAGQRVRLAVPQVLDLKLVQQRSRRRMRSRGRGAASRGSPGCCPRPTVSGRSTAPAKGSRCPLGRAGTSGTGDVEAVEEDPTFVGSDEADDHVEGRRLSRAVRAQQADDLALLDPDARHGPRPGVP